MNQTTTRQARVFVNAALELRDTHRYGHGVFARADIAAGTVLYDEAGVDRPTFSRAEILAHADTDHWQTHSYVLDTDCYYSGATAVVSEDITNFMNHSCDPNAWFDGDARMTARRFIPAGTEVTCDYATFETEISFHRGMICRCGSEQCRGRLSGTEYRNFHFRRRYSGHLSSYIETLLLGPSYYDDRLYVRRRADGVGCGVFTLAPVPARAVLVCYSGRVVSGEEMERYPEHYRRYNFQIGENLFQIPLSEIREVPDFVNHSCDPTAGLMDSVTVVARRDLMPGEEVTLDYATFNSGRVTGGTDNFECSCGSKLCRGTVRSDDYRRPDVQERLSDFFSSYLKELVRQESGKKS